MEVAIKKLRRCVFEEVLIFFKKSFFVFLRKKMKVGMRFPPLEVQLLRAVRPHPNLMQLFDVVETHNEVYLVQEFVNGCELFEYCLNKERLPEAEAQFFFRQIVRGMTWLHDQGIAHRDLSE
jgi:serine/threonine protein kinase